MTNHPKFTESHDSAARTSSSRTATGSRKAYTFRQLGKDKFLLEADAKAELIHVLGILRRIVDIPNNPLIVQQKAPNWAQAGLAEAVRLARNGLSGAGKSKGKNNG